MLKNQELAESLDRLSNYFMRQNMQELVEFAKEHDLSLMQLDIIMLLYYESQCDITEICKHMAVSRSAASQMVERMVQNGLVYRSDHQTDRRIKQVQLSENGRKFAEMRIAHRRKRIEQLVTDLKDGERIAVEVAIQALNRAISTNS